MIRGHAGAEAGAEAGARAEASAGGCGGFRPLLGRSTRGHPKGTPYDPSRKDECTECVSGPIGTTRGWTLRGKIRFPIYIIPS